MFWIKMIYSKTRTMHSVFKKEIGRLIKIANYSFLSIFYQICEFKILNDRHYRKDAFYFRIFLFELFILDRIF